MFNNISQIEIWEEAECWLAYVITRLWGTDENKLSSVQARARLFDGGLS